MPRVNMIFVAAVLVSTSALVAACSKPASAPSESAAPSDSSTTASSSPAAPAEAPAPTEAAPSATMIKLDIKDAQGNPVSGDPASGKQVFNQCMTCHSKDPGVNKVGPSLHGIIGRHSGMIPGFNYSTANKGSGLVWTEQELYTYLEDPQKTVPGTYMTFTGVKDPQKRADVIAFLQENTK